MRNELPYAQIAYNQLGERYRSEVQDDSGGRWLIEQDEPQNLPAPPHRALRLTSPQIQPTIPLFPYFATADYAALFPAFTFAQRARWNAAIFLRAAADIVRFTGVGTVVFAIVIG
jgi:hypothetical protein